MDDVINILDLVGTAVFAVTGALAAGRKRMDIFGVVVLGCVTALGGGTLRDVILGSQPIFWVSDTRYLALASIAAMGTFILTRRWKLPETILMYADALGLAVFTVIGFQKAFEATHVYGVAMVMGVMMGVAGGIVRDVLSGEVSLILRRKIYASASLCGAGMLALLSTLKLPAPVVLSDAILTTLTLRVVALRWNLTLPRFQFKGDRTSKWHALYQL